jgi:hypothetical protein
MSGQPRVVGRALDRATSGVHEHGRGRVSLRVCDHMRPAGAAPLDRHSADGIARTDGRAFPGSTHSLVGASDRTAVQVNAVRSVPTARLGWSWATAIATLAAPNLRGALMPTLRRQWTARRGRRRW